MTFKSGSGLSGSGIAIFTGAPFSNCLSSSLPTPLNVTATNFPWALNALHYNPSTHVTTGTVTGVSLIVSAPGCSAMVGNPAALSSVRFSYANGTHKLKLQPSGGNLTFFAVGGCSGKLNNGDPATVSATYTLTPPQILTSP